MKKYCIIIIALVTSWSVMSQTINFKKSYGNNGFDYGRGILQQHDSSYLVTGSSSSYNIHSTDAFIMHIDSMGNLLNTNFYGGSESDWGEKIVLGVDSTIAVAGYTNSIGAGGYDFYFFNCNQNKGMNYEKAYGGSGWDFAYDLIPLADSGYIIAGETSSFNAIGTDGYLIRIDKFGDTIWTQQFGPGNGNDVFKALQKINDTEFLVCGAAQHADSSHEDGYLRRMDIDGNLIWDGYYGTIYNDRINSIDTTNNEIYTIGYEGGVDDQENMMTFKVDMNGNQLWKNQTNFTGKTQGVDLIYHNYTDQYFYALDAESDNIPSYDGGPDIILNTAEYGGGFFNYNYFVRYGGIGPDESGQVISTSDNGIAFVGSTDNFGTGGSNVIIVKLNRDLDEIDNQNWTQDSILQVLENEDWQNISLYPNPTTNDLNIALPFSNDVYDLTIFDLNGTTLIKETVKGSNSLIDLSSIKSGNYILRLSNSNKIVLQQLITKVE